MSEINHKDFRKYLDGLSEETFSPVYLIHGEEYLCKSAFDDLLNSIVPPSKRSLNYEPVDEESEGINDVIERLNTFSLMPGLKVVSLCDSRLFHSKKEGGAIIEKAKSAFDKDDKKKAAKYLGSVLSNSGLSFEDVKTDKGKTGIGYSDSFSDDGKWMDELAEYSITNGIQVPQSVDSSKILKDALEKGLPERHHLIITADLVDKRKSLFDTIKKTGVVVNCSVPKGDRKVDKDQQAAVLRESIERILAGSGKELEPRAFKYLSEITGFDIRTFAGNLEKLVNYAGKRSRITYDDVKSLINRTKQDPIYELSGAVAERNLENALFYTGTLLNNSVYPLQVLATLVNQFRRLLLAKNFISGLPVGVWRNGMDYNSFRTKVMPHVKEYDALTKKRIEERDHLLAPPAGNEKKGKKKKKSSTDLILAKNPSSPYPVYLLAMNSCRYSMDELMEVYEILSKADRRLKSTGEDPKLILEDVIIRICRKKERPNPAYR